MIRQQSQVRMFMEEAIKRGAPQTIGTTPEIRDADLRKRLILEEAQEFSDAVDANDIVAAVDALGDLMYVLLGAAITFGIDLERAFDHIHAANMRKFGDGGYADENGKWRKPPDWVGPEDDIRKDILKELPPHRQGYIFQRGYIGPSSREGKMANHEVKTTLRADPD